MIQDRVDSEASRLVRMVGSATFTMVVSSRAMNIPASSTISASQERRGTSEEGSAPRGEVVAEAAGCSVMETVLRRHVGRERVGRERPGPFVGDDVG